jgi:hypothetical protein
LSFRGQSRRTLCASSGRRGCGASGSDGRGAREGTVSVRFMPCFSAHSPTLACLAGYPCCHTTRDLHRGNAQGHRSACVEVRASVCGANGARLRRNCMQVPTELASLMSPSRLPQADIPSTVPTSPRAGSLYQTSPRAGSLVGRPRSLSPMGMRTDAMYQSAPAVPVGQSFSTSFLQQVCCASGKNHCAAWSLA